MDIKLRARLSAYSKVDSLNTGCCSGEPMTKEHIDSLFTDTDEPQSVTKSEIDQLFSKTSAPESVTKTEIDELFDTSTSSVGTVSFKEIDSLFKSKR